MHIENIRKSIETLADKIRSEFEQGIDSVDVCEMAQATDMLKDLCDSEYKSRISVEMEESDEAGDGERRYYDNYRYANGRFAPKGHGTRRGYEPLYHMDPDMYTVYSPEYYRDMDRMDGRLYYTDSRELRRRKAYDHETTRDYREGRSGMSRKAYMESRELHPANTPQDKDAKIKDLENYMRELNEDVTELIGDMSPEERNLAKNKIQALLQKM